MKRPMKKNVRVKRTDNEKRMGTENVWNECDWQKQQWNDDSKKGKQIDLIL